MYGDRVVFINSVIDKLFVMLIKLIEDLTGKAIFYKKWMRILRHEESCDEFVCKCFVKCWCF